MTLRDIPADLSTDNQDPLSFRRIDRSVSLLKANFLMVYFAVPSVLLLGGAYVAVWGYHRLVWVLMGGYGWSLAALLVGIVVHEAIHGIAWKIAARKPTSAIRFGFHWKTLTPYAHCSEPMPARAYRIGAAMPLLLLGVLPSLAGIAWGSGALMAFGLFFTFAAGGDMLILWLLRDVPPDAQVEDHPVRAGCYVLLPAEGETAAPQAAPQTVADSTSSSREAEEPSHRYRRKEE
ncbi:MAG: DUF3267 domain-containing protein [Bacteroidetes bacterium]|nr:DUF3267 domain-containing protein [Bacteroidota bacterium]